MKRLLLLFLVVFLGFRLCAQDLQILCTQVNTDGTVSIKWDYTGVLFQSYIVTHKAMPSGAETVLDTITDITETTYTDLTVNANLNSYRYFVYLDTIGDPTYVFDSMNTCFLTVNNVSSSRYALLNWTSPNSNISVYNIFRKLPNASWAFITSTTNLSYQDTVPRVCSDTIYYRIEVETSPACNSISNVNGALFNDTESPDVPPSDTVSINLVSQKIQIGWTASTAPDVNGYIICQGSPCLLLDTIWGKNTTSYTWNAGNPDQIYSFRIVSFDSCLNTSVLTNVQNNMVLTAATKECSKEVRLSWNKYINLSPSADSYMIYVKNGNQNYVLAQQIPSSENTFTYTVPDEYNNACFYIRVSNANHSLTASSNEVCVDFMTPDTAGYLYLREASVSEDNSSVRLVIYADPVFHTNQYYVFRYASGEAARQIGTIPYTGKDSLFYLDNSAKPDTKPYYYYISVDNTCATAAKRSNIARSMYLQLEKQNQNKIKLVWTPYMGWKTIRSYDVYRKEENMPPELLVSLSGSDTSYIDNFGNTPFTQKVTYYIQAVEGNGNLYGFKDWARSSSAYYIEDGRLLIGNAFTPKGPTNNIFKPVFLFAENKDYKFSIYDRWGILVFETTNINMGWNGTYKNEYVPVGVYVYKIECFFSIGEKFSKMGVVNVLD